MLRWLALMGPMVLMFLESVRVSSACSPPCEVGKAAPLDGAMVPADVPALWLYTPTYANNPARVTLTDDANARIPIRVTTPGSDPYTHLVVLDKPLQAGHRYVLTWPQSAGRCDDQVLDVTTS